MSEELKFLLILVAFIWVFVPLALAWVDMADEWWQGLLVLLFWPILWPYNMIAHEIEFRRWERKYRE